MNSFIRKAYGAVRQYKFGIFKIILNRLFPEKFTYQSFILFKYNLKDKVSGTSPAKEAVTVKRIENPEEELFQQFREKFPATEFLSRIKKENQTAFIATSNGEIAGYSWVAEKELFIESINHNFVLSSDEIFIYACFVPREYRGKRIYPAMLYTILKDFSESNKYRMAYIGALAANKGSIKGIEKAGFEKQRRISYLKFLNREKWWGQEPASGPLEYTSDTKNESNPQMPEIQKAE